MNVSKKIMQNASNGKAPPYHLEHLVVAAIVILVSLFSAMTMGYHVWVAADVQKPFKLVAALFVPLVVFALSMAPLVLAKPHGEAINGGSAQSTIMMVVLGFMIIDGFCVLHAVNFTMKSMGMQYLSWWQGVILVGVFELSFFFARGAVTPFSAPPESPTKARRQIP